ncbi:MAG: 30S ribosomal protein S20 [Anaerolineales bacterium]|nr:30S ribosomal protein S20 [Anaerolineales bacterium]
MANIKSAMKRNRQNIKRRLRNRQFRGKARSYVKQARHALEVGELEAARTETLIAVRALDKAASKGVIHKNNAARRKSRLMKRLSALESEA